MSKSRRKRQGRRERRIPAAEQVTKANEDGSHCMYFGGDLEKRIIQPASFRSLSLRSQRRISKQKIEERRVEEEEKSQKRSRESSRIDDEQMWNLMESERC